MANLKSKLTAIFTTEDEALHAAAVRAGLKTAAQTARGTGAAVLAAIGATVIGVDWTIVGGIAGAGLITTVWAGADAYLDKIGNGLPVEYIAASKGAA